MANERVQHDDVRQPVSLTRRHARSWVLVLCASLAASVAATVDASAASQAPGRPNVVVIMTDDQDSDSMRYLPKTLALLGATGTTFSNSFTSLSICCPSRATFLTGQYPHNHGVTTNLPEEPGGGYPALDSSNTLPVWLQRAGYHTTFIGKYLNGDPLAPPPGWSDWQALRYHRYNMFGYGINDNGVERRYGTAPADYQTDVLAGRAVTALQERAAATQPFFLWIAPTAPHTETADADVPADSGPRPAPRDVGTLASAPLPKPPSFNEADVTDKTSYVRARSPVSEESMTRRFHARIEALQAVDDLVERVVHTLSTTGELENTLIVFTSDNGFLLGQHRAIGKTWVYEESIRVPLLFRGGGFPAGKTASQLVANIDLAPTIVKVTGISSGHTMDGRSLLPLAQESARGRGRRLLISGVSHLPETSPGPLNFKAVRTERYLWVEYESTQRELYDLQADPYQLTSRHADPALASTRSTLASQLAALRTCRGSACSRGVE